MIFPKFRSSISTCLLVALAGALPAQADPAAREPDDPFASASAGERSTAPSDLDAAEPPRAIDNITVVARPRQSELREAPVAVSAFTELELEVAGVEELFDVQYLTPNLQFLGNPTGGSVAVPVIRGLSQSDVLLTTDSSVGVYVDGVNLPRQLGLKSNSFDLESIEVLKGPQGTLYGRNTTGGAIRITSKGPSLSDGLSGFAQIRAGSFRTLQLSGALNLPIIDDRLALRVAGHRAVREGFGKSRFTDRALSDDDELFLRASLLFEPNESLRLRISGDVQQADESGFVQKLTGILSPQTTGGLGAAVQATLEQAEREGAPLGPLAQAALLAGGAQLEAGTAALREAVGGNAFRSLENERTGNRFRGFGIAAGVTLDRPDYRLHSITGYRTFDRRSILDLDATPFTILGGDFQTDLDFFSQELRLEGGALEGRLAWLVGAYYSTESGNETQNVRALEALVPDARILQGDVTNTSIAGFTQLALSLTERLKLTLGYRYTREEKDLISRNRLMDGSCTIGASGSCRRRFSDRFRGDSWDASLDYALTEDVFTYARVAKGFRGGGQNLRGTADAGSFASFDPESALSYELGLKSSWLDRRLTLDLSGFYTDYQDVQRTQLVPSDQTGVTTVLKNAASAHIVGYEVETTLVPIPGLTLRASFGYTNAAYEDFDDLVPTPEGDLVLADRQDEAFSQSAKYSTTLSGNYTRQLGPGLLGLSASWYLQPEIEAGSSRGVDAEFQGDNDILDIDEYNLLNVRVDYALGPYQIALYANNVLDEEYALGAASLSAFGFAAKLTGDPRVVGLQLRRSF